MTAKEKVVATRLKGADAANVTQFAELKGITETEATRAIIQRYFKLTYKEREALEKKLHWEKHRNLGFRVLPSFASPKRAAKVSLLPASPQEPIREG